MKRVIITGATGFVGANLARRLLGDGHEVHLLVRPGYKSWRIEAIRSNVRIHEVSFADEKALATIISKIKPDWVFHLAAYGAYSSQNELKQIIDTNIMGTISLVGACLKVGFESFINTGSSSEYGYKDHAPGENEFLEPNSYYAVAKASAALFCRYTAQKKDVRITTLRLYSVYGPYEEPSRLMPTLIMYGLKGKFPPLVNPDVARDFVYVDDVSETYILAASQPSRELGAIYNVGAGLQITMREVIDVAREIMHIKDKPVWGSIPNRNWDTNIWIADNRKIQNELGWQPRYTFKQGFKLMLDWFCDNLELRDFYYGHYPQLNAYSGDPGRRFRF